MPNLRPYQGDAVRANRAAFAAGQRLCLTALPTGTGKTLVEAELVRVRGPRALFIAHREELLNQAEAKLLAAGIAPDRIGRVMAGRDDFAAPLVLASIQTLSRETRRDRVGAGEPFRTIVIDEAHHYPARTYRAAVEALAGPETLVAGFTATPDREGMEDFGAPVYSRTILDMIGEGWLVDLRALTIELDMSFRTVRRTAGDYRTDDLARELLKAQAPALVTQAWLEHGEGRQTLIFTPTVEVAYACRDAFRIAEVDADAVDGTTPAEERSAILKRFSAGETTVLANCALLTEGVDIPACSCVVIARPTMSPLLYAQMIGRGTRLAEGKSDCLILDVAGATKRHDLSNLRRGDGPQPINLTKLLGIPVGEGQSVNHAAFLARELAPLLDRIQRVRMTDVDLFGGKRSRSRWEQRQAKEAGASAGVGWIDLDHGMRLLDWGQNTRIIARQDEDETWRLESVSRQGTTRTLYTAFRTEASALARGREMSFELGRRDHAEKLWRGQASGPAQWDYMTALDPSVSLEALKLLDKGQVSDLIGVELARRTYQVKDRETA